MTVTAKGLSIDPHLSCSNRWHTALHFQPKGNKTQEQQREKEARRSEYFTQKQFFRTVNVSGVQFKSPGVVRAERIESQPGNEVAGVPSLAEEGGYWKWTVFFKGVGSGR